MRLLLLLVISCCTLLAVAWPAHAAVPDGNVWISLDSISSQLAGPSGSYSYAPSLSADGSYVAFQSMANIVREGDVNDLEDVFRRDVANSVTTLVSQGSNGAKGNNRSYAPDMAGDGAIVAFESLASNLVANDANNAADVFVRDLTSATTARISLAAGGGDANGPSFRPAISNNGAFVAFCSRATNLVANDSNSVASAFLFERASGTMTKIPLDEGSEATAGCARVAINNDGSVIAVTNVVGGVARVFTYDRASGTTTPLTANADASSGLTGLAISGDGKLVAFDSLAANLTTDDSNRSRDVFAWKVADGSTKRVSVRTDGTQLPADSGSSGVAVSRDGRYVVFGSTANEVVPGDSNGREDIFRYDVTTSQATIASVSVNDRPANDSSYAPDISDNGSVVVYATLAANIVPGDGNRYPDVYLRGTTFLDKDGDGGPAFSGTPKDNPLEVISYASDSETNTLIYAGVGVGAAVVVLVGAWFVLGRRGRA
jgi:hypothetical protein